jgi:hypothetical protein
LEFLGRCRKKWRKNVNVKRLKKSKEGLRKNESNAKKRNARDKKKKIVDS